MDELLTNLSRELLLKNIRECMAKAQISPDAPDNRFLLFQVAGPVCYSYISYHQDHAATTAEIARRVFHRAPRLQGSSIVPIDYGVVFDTQTQEILAYMLRPV
jgi:hypothetical protein